MVDDAFEVIKDIVGPEGAAIMDEIAKDPEAYLNAFHVPEDAGEYAKGLAKVLARIPEGRGRWISCGKGWYPLIVETDQRLAAIDPNYVIFQVKEKFGRCRYYHSISADCDYETARAIESETERRSGTICEVCGAPGTTRSGGWIQTLCDEHGDHRPEIDWGPI